MACSWSLMPWGFWPGMPAPMGRPPGSIPGRLLIVVVDVEEVVVVVDVDWGATPEKMATARELLVLG